MERSIILFFGVCGFLAVLFSGILATLAAEKMPALVGKVGKFLRVDYAKTYFMLSAIMALFCIFFYAFTAPPRTSLTGWLPTDSPRTNTFDSLTSPCPAPIAGKPKTLNEVIQQQQAACVGDSVGPWAHEAFTKVRLQKFKDENTVQQIGDLLRKEPDFLGIVETIRSMPQTERVTLLNESSHKYRPTWEQLGLDPTINSSEELLRGTTVAGQEAERLIAEGIVGMVRLRL